MSRRHLPMLLALSTIWVVSFPGSARALAGLALVLAGVALETGALRPIRLARRRAQMSADRLRP